MEINDKNTYEDLSSQFPDVANSNGGEQCSLTSLSKRSTYDMQSLPDAPTASFPNSDFVQLLPIHSGILQSTVGSGIYEFTFDGILASPNVSASLSHRFRTLRDMVYSINVRLFSDHDNAGREGDVIEAREMAASLSKWLANFGEIIKTRVDTVNFVKQLAPFTIQPTGEGLWLLYKQRAELIIRYTYLPRFDDLRVLQRFIELFENFLILKMLQRGNDIEADLHDSLLEAYLKLLATERGYREWVQRMKELADIYMRPLLTDIVAHAELQNAILQQTDGVTRAFLDAEEMECLPMRLPSMASNICMGRSGEMVKHTRRFRRQHTL